MKNEDKLDKVKMQPDKMKTQSVHTREAFRNQVVNVLSQKTTDPMFCVWLDEKSGWGFAVGSDVRTDPNVRKAVGSILISVMKDLNLFDEISTKVD